MKNKETESMSDAHGTALGLLAKFKDLSVGEKRAEQECVVDQRFITVTAALLESCDESEVMAWLLGRCECLDCLNIETPDSPKRLPRIDMVNSEVSFRHLMEQVKFKVITSS